MIREIIAIILATSAGIASAADAQAVGPAAGPASAPVIGPAPPWVTPTAMPPAPTTSDGAAVRVMLQDQQIALDPGRETTYSAFAIAIQTPQGLAAGNISIPWRPETDILTVHRLLIHRGDKVIDILGSGQSFTVARREANLENAVLDGVLTANIQPEGLQVGDIIDFAASIATSDPVLKGHVEQAAAAWNGVPITRAHFRADWPEALPVRLRQAGTLPALKPARSKGRSSVEFTLDNVEPLNLPKGAPARFQIGRLVELSDFASWSDLGTLLAPLYVKAATLPAQGALQAELQRLRALPNPKTRAEAALALVQDRVRYVALAMGEGGMVPADAETTWARKFGDCKAKTALLLALLHALDIKAEPVAVNALSGDGIDQRLPMIGAFNHVIVRADIGGHAYWLDGTRSGDTRLDRIAVPSFGWGLPLVAGAALIRMVPAPLEVPNTETAIRLDASAGLTVPAPARIERVFRGDNALGMHLGLANLSAEARDRAMRDYWKGEYDFLDVTSVSERFDPASGEQRLVMEGKARMDWSTGWYETDGTAIGYKADFTRKAGPDQDAPFAVPYPYYSHLSETITLPPGFHDTSGFADANVDQTAGGIHYVRKAGIANGVFTVDKSERSVAPEFAFKDAAAAQVALRDLAKKTVYLRVPADYRATADDVASVLTRTPTTVKDYLGRGNFYLDQHRYDDALADFNAVLAKEPKNGMGLADRGIAKVWKHDYAGAAADLDAAAAIDPQNYVIYHARGLMAQGKNAPEEAIGFYTKALALSPGSDFALSHRAQAQRAAGHPDLALADADAMIKLNPQAMDAYLLRANIYRSQGKRDQALGEAATLSKIAGSESFPHVAAAQIYAAYDRQADAIREFDAAIAIKPEAYIYINRFSSRARDDRAGRHADVDAALKLDPNLPEALAARATLQDDEGDHAGAIVSWSAAIAHANGENDYAARRGIAYLRAGQPALAEKDFATARAVTNGALALNNLCWAKATAGLALESALADCDAALVKEPGNSAYLDSRGLVLLRLGRLDEAIAAYDKALASDPDQSSSLYGRALAWGRKGDRARAESDAAAATKLSPRIAEAYKQYGLQL